VDTVDYNMLSIFRGIVKNLLHSCTCLNRISGTLVSAISDKSSPR